MSIEDGGADAVKLLLGDRRDIKTVGRGLSEHRSSEQDNLIDIKQKGILRQKTSSNPSFGGPFCRVDLDDIRSLYLRRALSVTESSHTAFQSHHAPTLSCCSHARSYSRFSDACSTIHTQLHRHGRLQKDRSKLKN